MGLAVQDTLEDTRADAGRWRRPNSWLYRLASRLGGAWNAARGRRLLAAASASPAATDPREDRPTLYLSWGRAGDAILQSGFTARYREWFPGPLIAVGRPETRAVLENQVDRFLPFDAREMGSGPGRRDFLAALPRRCGLLITDIHLFHGGELLTAIADAVRADRTLAYGGWADPAVVAPRRILPRHAEVVPPRSRPRPATDPERVHVFFDLIHYHRAVLEALDEEPDRASAACLPELSAQAIDPSARRRLGLAPGSYVACQPVSSQRKKDFPATRWRQVLAARPDLTFVLLGSRADARSFPAAGLANTVDLRGRTTLPEAFGVLASARAFVGVDSGLAHAAATLATPTVVVMPSSSAGYFFPYPEALARGPLITVLDPAYAGCAGCLGICSREPIWHSRRRGFPCLRDLPTAEVVAALDRAMARSGTRAAAETGSPASPSPARV